MMKIVKKGSNKMRVIFIDNELNEDIERINQLALDTEELLVNLKKDIANLYGELILGK